MMMTTVLMSYFLIYKKKWNTIAVIGFILVFGIIESSFFITNVAKIKQRWMFLFFELFIFSTMYAWYYARKINNKFIKFVDADLITYNPKVGKIYDEINIHENAIKVNDIVIRINENFIFIKNFSCYDTL